MFGRSKHPPVSPQETARRARSTVDAIGRANGLLRTSAAEREPDQPFTVSSVRQVARPMTADDLAESMADLMTFALAHRMDVSRMVDRAAGLAGATFLPVRKKARH